MAEAPWGGSEELWAGAALAALAANWDVHALLPRFNDLHPKRAALVKAGVSVAQWSFDEVRQWNAAPATGARPTNPYRDFFNPRPDLLLISHGGLMDMVNGHAGMLSELWSSGVPYVIVIQANTEGYWPNDAQRAYMRQYFGAALQVVFVSRQNLEMARRQLADRLDNAVVWQQPVNLASVKPVKWPNESALALASVARLDVAAKGQDLLLEILSRPVWRARPWTLNLYGAGPSASLLQESAAVGGIQDRVHFHGQVADIAELWRANHALVMPSRLEGTPLALLEALCCGRPAVVTDVGGSADWIIEGETGFVVSSARADALATALDQLWERRGSLRKMGEAAARFMRESFEPKPGATLFEFLDGRRRRAIRSMVTTSIAPQLSIIRLVPGSVRAKPESIPGEITPEEIETIWVVAGAAGESKRDGNTILVPEPLSNPAAAANAGLRAARGQTVLLVGENDEIPPDYLRSLIGRLKTAPAPSLLCAAAENTVPTLGVFPHARWQDSGGFPPNARGEFQSWLWKRFRTEGAPIQTLANLPRDGAPAIEASSTPRVTVVVTCYNYARFLGRCLDSVLGQTFRDFEVIIVNDGSTDSSGQVADSIAAMHPDRVRVLHQENAGQPAISRNNGIQQARGELILPLDADDWIAPTMLRECVTVLEAEPKVGVAYVDTMYCFDTGAVQLHPAGQFTVEALRQNNRLSCCSMYRKVVWTKVGGYRLNVRGYEDWDFWLATAIAGFAGRRIPKPLFFYRAKATGVFADTSGKDQVLRAQIVLNNPRGYSEAERAQAEGIFEAAKRAPQAVTKSTAGAPALVSVVIPCYRQAAFLAEAVESVMAQTYPHWEIVIVNDGSPDNTSAVAQELIRRHAGRAIRLVEKQNGGLADARNAGIRFARGSYILPLDADDKIHPEMLAKTVALLDARPSVAIAYVDWQYFGAESRVRHALEYDFRHLATKENLFTCTSLFRREAWDAAGGYNRNLTHGVEDWDFWIGCGEKGFVGQRIPEVLFFYRVKPDSMIQQLQPYLGAMFARIIMNHPGLYGTAVVEKAKATFAAAKLPPPKPSSPGVEWQPGDADEIDESIRSAETLMASGEGQKAIALLRQVLSKSPGEVAVKRIQTLVAAMPKPGDAGRTANSAGSTKSSALATGPDGLKRCADLVQAFQNGVAAATAELRQLRDTMTTALTSTPADALARMMTGDFGKVYRSMTGSGLILETATPEEQAAITNRTEEITAAVKLGKPVPAGALLAHRLWAPAYDGPIPPALDLVPAWLVDEFIDYLLQPPLILGTPGEADRYHQHLVQVGVDFKRRVASHPASPLTLNAAFAFATRVNCIPVYATGANTREFMQLRAEMLEFVLKKKGAILDSNLRVRPASGRIRVGFLSAHFGPQTETHVTLPTLQLDRTKFETWLFAIGANPSPIEDYCRSFSDRFVVLPGDLAQQAKAIREANLDVIVIGTNVTAVTNGVALLACHRLAPVQLVSYCSPMTTGMRHVDGYLFGSHSRFEGVEEQFSEKLIECEGPPGCLDYTHEKPGSMRFTREMLGIHDDEVVFVNAAACFKIPAELLDVWARILKQVEKSRLVLLPFNPNWSSTFPKRHFIRVVEETLRRHGVAADRVIFVDSLPSRADVLELEKIGDIYLDTFPFSGSLSVIDPLQLGIPTVVAPGGTARGQAAAALLREIDLPELIATDEAGYIALATRLGQDRPYRSEFAPIIRERMDRRPRFVNPPAYGRQLGDVLGRLVSMRRDPATKAPALQCA